MEKKNITILVVEDEETIRELLEIEMQELGFDVVLSGSVENAIAVLNSEKSVDIGLVDLWLGDGSGMDVLKHFHLRHPGIPVVLMTGHGNKSVILEAFKLGAFDYLEKPFSVKDDLIPVLGRAEGTVVLTKKNAFLQAELGHSAKLAAMGELSAIILHDIRGPLSSIQLCCEDIVEEAKCKGVLSHIEIADRTAPILDGCARIGKMAAHLRGFSRADGKEAEVVASVKELVDCSLYLVKKKVRDGKIVLVKNISDSLLNSSLKCDKNSLEDAIMNLCSNACDAMQDTSKKTMTVSVHLSSEFVEISVADTGTGMSPEIILKLEKSYFTTKPAGKGTGIGVKIVRDAALRMGGVLKITSEIGVGSVFSICLPIARLSDGSSESSENAKNGEDKVNRSTSKNVA